MASTISTISNILEKDIAPAIQRELFDETVLLNHIKRNAGNVRMANNTFYISAQTAHHGGTYSIAEDGTIYTGSPTYDQMSVGAKWTFTAHEITDQSIEACKGEPGSLASIVVEFGNSAKTTMAKEMNRQFFGYGEGILAIVTTGAASATQTVDTTRYLYPTGKLLLDTDTNIEAGTADDGTVSSVASSTSVVLTASVTTATSDRVTRYGVYDTSGSAYNEMQGLKGLIDESGGFTTTFQGKTRASTSWVNSYIDDDAEQLDEADMNTAIVMAEEYGTCDFIITGYKLQQKYGTLLTSLKRAVNTTKLDGGWSGLTFSAGKKEIPIVRDYDCLYGEGVNYGASGEMFFVDSSSFSIGQLAPVGWLDRGEGVLKKVSGKPNYEAILKFYGNLLCYKPKANAALQSKTNT